jgi:hypothetical protein
VDNTSDANKPVSAAQQNAINGRVPLPTGDNTRFGDNAQTSAAMTGVNNNAFGKQTQLSLTTGMFNNAFGNDAQRDLTTGVGNTAAGNEAHRNLATGSLNSAVGFFAQHSLQAGNNNTAVGSEAQYSLSSGSNNNAVGTNAQRSLTTGVSNNAVGAQAQQSPLADNTFATTTGSRQVSVGHETGQNTATQLDEIVTVGHRATAGANKGTALGAFSRADHSDSVALGSDSQTTAGQQVAIGPRALLVGNSTTAPTVNPTAGGVLYTTAGSLLYRGSGGAITRLAEAGLSGALVITVADFTALATTTSGRTLGDLAFVVEGAVYMSWTGTVWRQVTTATFASTAARDTAYAKAGAVYRVAGVRALDTSTSLESQRFSSAWLPATPGMFALRPTSAGGTNVTVSADGRVTQLPAATGGISVHGVFNQGFSRYLVKAQFLVENASPINMRVSRNFVFNGGTNYFQQTLTSAAAVTTSARVSNATSFNLGGSNTTNTIHNVDMEVTNPGATSAFVRISSRLDTLEVATGNATHSTVTGGEALGSAIDGFLWFPNSGAMSGNIRVYGFTD